MNFHPTGAMRVITSNALRESQPPPSRWSDVRALSGSDSDSEPLQSLSRQPRWIDARLEDLPRGGGSVMDTEPCDLIIVVMRGTQRLVVDGVESQVSRGEYAVVPAGTAREEQAEGDKPAVRLIVSFDGNDLFLGKPLVARDCSGRVRALSSWLLEQRTSKFGGVTRYREQILDLLLFELGRAPVDRSTAVERSTRTYVLEHIADSITLADLARNAGMSRHYFCRQYHRLTGKSPMMMVRILRLERARELVVSTALSLEEIAVQVGIRSHYHLSRLLTSHFGVGFRQLRRHATQLAENQ